MSDNAVVENKEGLNVDASVTLRNRDEVVSDLVKHSEMTDIEANEAYNEIVKQYVLDRIDAEFAKDDSMMGMLREIKEICESRLSKDGLRVHEDFMRIRGICNQLFLD